MKVLAAFLAAFGVILLEAPMAIAYNGNGQLVDIFWWLWR